jgi:hypothetical protein
MSSDRGGFSNRKWKTKSFKETGYARATSAALTLIISQTILNLNRNENTKKQY